jgi:hypothetical protein
MQHPQFPVSVLMRCVPVVSRWISEKWEIAGVDVDTGCEAIVREPEGPDAWRWRGFWLDLHPSEAEGYYLNLSAPEPKVFVMWRQEPWEGSDTARPWVATVSYHEAARMMDGGETVDGAAMPVEVRDWVAPWLAANYRPEPRRKQRRNAAFWREGDPPLASGEGR